MLVYFHIDEVARDSIVASALNQELKVNGGKLIYGNRFFTSYLLRHINCFDAILLPSLQHFMLAFPDPRRLPQNVFILQTEAVGQATGTLRRMHAKYFGNNHIDCIPWHKSVCGYLLWGHSHLNAFKEYYPHYLPRVRVVGHPRLATICTQPPLRKRREKKTIGIVSRFSLLNPFDRRYPFESVANGMRFDKHIFPLYENSPHRDVEDLFYTEVIDLRVILQIITLLDASKYDVHVRPHPRESRHGWMRLARRLNLNISISPWDEPFSYWLADIDIVVTPPSTSLYDAYYHRKKVVLVDSIVPSRAQHLLTESDDNNQILQGACRPASVNDAIKMIDSGNISVNQEVIQSCLYDQISTDLASNSIRNIVNSMLALQPPVAQANKLKRYSIAQVFQCLIIIVSSSQWLKNCISGDPELGSTFFLTLKRILWINNLTSRPGRKN